jgi:spore germination protein GerM
MRFGGFLITATLLFALTLGMSVYVWQLRRRELRAHRVSSINQTSHVTPPVTSNATEDITLYVAYDDPGELRTETLSIPAVSNPQQRAETILRALLNVYTAKESPHPLAVSSEIRNVFLIDRGTAVVDLNSELVGSQVSGVLAEELTVLSMVETLAKAFPDVLRVKFLVDGKERDTLAGHVDLANFYEVSQTDELVKQLSPR